MIFATVWLGIIGFIDDYLKLRAKKIAQQQGIPYKKGDKDGLAGWFKILGQVVLGFVVAATLLFNDNTKVWREYVGDPKDAPADTIGKRTIMANKKYLLMADDPITTIPFVKGHEFNYSKLLPAALRGVHMDIIYRHRDFYNHCCIEWRKYYRWSGWPGNGNQCHDRSLPGHICLCKWQLRFAEYLNIMYIPNLGELSIFIGAMIGPAWVSLVQCISGPGISWVIQEV